MSFTAPSTVNADEANALAVALINTDAKVIAVDQLSASITTPQQLNATQAVFMLDTWMQSIKAGVGLQSMLAKYPELSSTMYTDPLGTAIELFGWAQDRITDTSGRLAFLTDRRFQLTPPFPDVQLAMQNWFIAQEADWKAAIDAVNAKINAVNAARAGGALSSAQADLEISSLTDLLANLGRVHGKLYSVVNQMQSSSLQSQDSLTAWGIFIVILAAVAIFFAPEAVLAATVFGVSVFTIASNMLAFGVLITLTGLLDDVAGSILSSVLGVTNNVPSSSGGGGNGGGGGSTPNTVNITQLLNTVMPLMLMMLLFSVIQGLTSGGGLFAQRLPNSTRYR